MLVIPSTYVIQLTLTLKMTTAKVVETSVTAVNKNSPIQDYIYLDDQTQPTFENNNNENNSTKNLRQTFTNNIFFVFACLNKSNFDI